MHPSIDLSLFPDSTSINSSGHLSIAGHDLANLVAQFGTPLYVYDGTTVRGQVDRLRALLKRYYPAESTISYAAKAYYSRGFAAKMAALGIGADVVSLGEMNMARTAGVSASLVHLHGNNKSEAELQAALDWSIRAIVVDNLDELAFLEKLTARRGQPVRIWLRITPDIPIETHAHIETSHTESKFGLHLSNGDAAEAIRRAKASPWLDLIGLHTHLGSQIKNPEPYRKAIELLLQAAATEDYVPQAFSPGGGWGVRYHADDPPDDAAPWVQAAAEAVQDGCTERGWPFPCLVLEPGRWLAARAGVAIYTVGAQKITPDGTRIAAVDGGLADNPRVALYQARYSALVVQKAATAPNTKLMIAGKYCETGDVLIPEIMLPNVERGDLLAVPVSGAYQLSMASNYNLAARPAVLWLEQGSLEILQTGEQINRAGWWVDRE